MVDNVGQYFILNKEVKPAAGMDSLQLQSRKSVYEVIRILDGVPLFFEEHFLRMKESLKLLGFDSRTEEEELYGMITDLVKQNGERFCNVKIIVYPGTGEQDVLLYIIKSHYPGRDEVEKGVDVSLMHWERENPNVKLVNHVYKAKVAEQMEKDGVFEVLLVNSRDEITEGSRSNAFFVKGRKVFTAPEDQVLKGITRQYVLDVCRHLGMEVIEGPVKLEMLSGLEGLFLSGTSIKVLPVARINERNYASGSHPSIVAIRDGFDRMLEDHVNRRRKR